MTIDRTAKARPRSVAWIYYAVITILLVIAALGGLVSALPFAVGTGLYSLYLFRGGRFALWIW